MKRGGSLSRCIDRYYIERFLQEHAGDIRGRVLEIADSRYTHQYGGERVIQADVLHVDPNNPNATITGDLTAADHIPSHLFDCIIFTQTLQFIYDFRAAIRTLHRILKPQGVLLATCHGISKISRGDMDHWGEYWRFTTRSASSLFAETFVKDSTTVQAHGNVLAAIAYLHGLTWEELSPAELDFHDPDFELLITVRAVKPMLGS